MSTTKARRTTLSLIHQRDRAYGQMEKVLAYLERWLQGPEPPTHLAGLAAKSAEMVNASAPTEQSVLKVHDARVRGRGRVSPESYQAPCGCVAEAQAGQCRATLS